MWQYEDSYTTIRSHEALCYLTPQEYLDTLTETA